MKFLGHEISAMDPDEVAAVRDWPPPTNVSELRSFLGLTSYYWRLVRDFTTIASPLHKLTKKGQTFMWEPSVGLGCASPSGPVVIPHHCAGENPA